MISEAGPMIANIAKKLGLAAVALSAAASLASAADLSPSYKAPVKAIAPVESWTGFYVGGNVGYGWDSGPNGISARATNPILAPAVATLFAAGVYPTSLSTSAKGVIGGGQAGYNWQMSQWLFGLEADIQASGIKGSTGQTLSIPTFDTTSTGVTKSIDWFGTFRGRVGVLATPQWLFYATGGLAYGQTRTSFTTTDLTFGCFPFGSLCATGASSSVRAGWTVGAGTEAMLAPNWSVKFEYLYVDLGRRSLDIPSFTVPVTFNTSTVFRENIVRVGLNYHFNMGGPVVARY
jgi:outer membrane immunogenic protein